MTRKFIVSGIFAAVAAAMSAVPASDSPMLRTLPDGTSIEIMLHGDENFHYATLLDGSIVKEGDDGYFYYAEVTADGIVATPYKVGDNVPKQRVVKSTGVKSRLQALRSQALQRRAVKPHTAQRSASDINSQHGLVILVDYPDMPMVQTNKDYSEMLNSEGYSKNYATGSALDYFRNSSYGKYSPVFDVFGPYTLSNKYRYYGKNDASGNDTNVPEMIVEACRMASADVDLSTYDYDNDGYIDNVYVFYAGAGEANGGSDDTVWPHRWVVYGENYDGDPDVGGVKVYDYACSNEIRESLKNKTGRIWKVSALLCMSSDTCSVSATITVPTTTILPLIRATTTSWLRHRISTMDVRLTDIQPMSVCIWDGLSQRRYSQAAMATR